MLICKFLGLFGVFIHQIILIPVAIINVCSDRFIILFSKIVNIEHGLTLNKHFLTFNIKFNSPFTPLHILYLQYF